MATSVNRLTNANVYLNGNSLLGQAESFEVPGVKPKMSDHKALGMIGLFQLPSGIDKLEGKIKFTAWYPEVWKSLNNIYKAHDFTVRGNLETYEGAERVSEVAAVVFMKATVMDPGNSKFNHQDNVEVEATLNVLSLKYVIDGEEIVHYDATNNIYRVGGEDLTATYRANTGT